MTKATILVSLDQNPHQSRRGLVDYYECESAYLDAILKAGGLPLPCPWITKVDDLKQILDHVDAVLLSGGDFDINPNLFGEAAHAKLGTIKEERTTFETHLYELAKERELPILGICGGMQLINCLEGGSLYQDIPSQYASDVAHEQHEHKSIGTHAVKLIEGQYLHTLLQTESIMVNSTHHQGIKELANTLINIGHSEDLLVEAFKHKEELYIVGVQWHPESMPDNASLKLYHDFVAAAYKRRSG
jgi:putative glutamine amidotransferase